MNKTGVFRFIFFRLDCFLLNAMPESISRNSPTVGFSPHSGSLRYRSTLPWSTLSQSKAVRLGVKRLL